MDDDLRVSKNWQATPQGNGTTAVKWNEIWEIPTNPKCYPIISDTIHFTMCTFRPSLITLTWRRRCSQSHWAPVKHMAKELECKTTSSSKISSLIFCFFSSHRNFKDNVKHSFADDDDDDHPLTIFNRPRRRTENWEVSSLGPQSYYDNDH